jgi:uncharacterized protein with NRDE domain
MCTLLAIVPPPGGVLQVAANRDEFLARPASPPHRWDGSPPLLAPRDEQAGGTWLGVSARGLFVGVTNRHGMERDAARASRGALVVDALRARSVEALHQDLAGLDAQTYNPFHLLYADGHGRAGLTWSDGAAVQQRWLRPGLHVLTERSLGAGDDEARVAHARAALDGASAPVPFDAWATLLRIHAVPDPRQGTCLHVPAFGYGTRSSFVLRLGADPARALCAWTEGPPCTSRWVDGTKELRTVVAAGRPASAAPSGAG